MAEYKFAFRTPKDLRDARGQLRKLERNIKNATAARADCLASRYDLGVKVNDERLAELADAKAHFEAWINAQTPKI